MSITSASLINSRIESDGVLRFQLENVNHSIANALRRTILSDIPCLAFKTTPHNENEANFIKNTTRLNNEILKQRLACIPIHIKDLDSDYRNLVVEIEKKNETENVILVTTEDFKIKDTNTDTYLSTQAVNKIFPPNSLTGDHIIFCRLKPRISNEVPGEEIKVHAKISLQTAAVNSAYNVASTCAYGNSVDKVKQDEKWQEIREKISEQVEESEIKSESIELAKQNWYNHEGKRITLENSFDFIIESVGVYKNCELVEKACDVLIKGLTDIMNMAQQDELNIVKSENTIANCYDIILQNTDYTLGKSIEYGLFEKFFNDDENRHLSYIAFALYHPHDDYSVIRLAFMESEFESNTDFISMCRQDISMACGFCVQLFADIKGDFV